MFKKLFSSKTKIKETTILSPISGDILPISEVPDPVFSQKMMGDGFAIEPTEGKVVSPVEGEVVQLFHTKHAIGLKTEAGTEILIHIGLETVEMKGEGFEAHVKQGDKVNIGTPLITFDISLIKEKAKSSITPIVITNSDASESFKILAEGTVQKGSTVCAKVIMK
ncbi:PTS sugar transporter subunit IIA [Priestia megaterium]|jgi:PTS system glucose-specific IIA component|uniref:PTS sugar transporter subunit IIA n=3 Tax=Priestia megaterium TaxID=1404 RepID=UPI0003FB4D54|nr:PTS glucose transporter subunit IIA [Priestia megaterium]MBW0933508.1 PTS glucose transporter subunit IIA [Priestia megaterium]